MTHKLLLADDSVTIQRVVELTFSGEDVQVVTVGDGEQAIARIPLEHPDIVLADIGMPKRSGYDVAAFVKGRPDLSHIPVLLLAGAFEPVDEARAQQVKSDGVLVKPFEPQQVISRVRELIDGGRGKPTQPPREPSPVMAAFESRTHQLEARASAPEPRTIEHRPLAETRLSTPEPHASAQETSFGADDYFDFDRLDAAFARLGSEPDQPEPARSSRHHDDYGAGFDVPTVDSLLASAPIHDIPPASVTRAPLPNAMPAMGSQAESVPAAGAHGAGVDATGSGRNIIADVFSALFAAEQGEADAPPIHLGAPPAALVVTDELVEEVTRRVLQRLAPNAARDVVAQIVSEVAERLVREEIARIKSAVATRR